MSGGKLMAMRGGVAPTRKQHIHSENVTRRLLDEASDALANADPVYAMERQDRRAMALYREQLATPPKYNNTDVLLILWYARKEPKPRIKKLCLRLAKLAPAKTANGIIKRILNASDPGKEIVIAGNEVTEFEKVLEHFGETEGCHGVAMHNRVVYPVQFTFEEDEDYKWAIENEAVMRVKVAQALMNQLNLQEMSCEVLLFGTKGFSADYTGVHVAHQNLNRPGVTVTADGMIVE